MWRKSFFRNKWRTNIISPLLPRVWFLLAWVLIAFLRLSFCLFVVFFWLLILCSLKQRQSHLLKVNSTIFKRNLLCKMRFQELHTTWINCEVPHSHSGQLGYSGVLYNYILFLGLQDYTAKEICKKKSHRVKFCALVGRVFCGGRPAACQSWAVGLQGDLNLVFKGILT